MFNEFDFIQNNRVHFVINNVRLVLSYKEIRGTYLQHTHATVCKKSWNLLKSLFKNEAIRLPVK